MKNIAILTKKELRDLFTSPIAYVVFATFLVISSLLFIKDVFVVNQAEMRDFFELVPMLLIVVVPGITMRSWSEEKREGTIEILATLPFSRSQLIIGKFLSNFLFITIAILLTAIIPVTLNVLGNPDNGVIIAGYIGLLMLAAAYTVIGQFVSINTQNQIVSLILSAVLIAILYIIGEPGFLQFVPATLRGFFEALALGTHFESIAKGVLDTRDILYYVSIITILLLSIYKSFERIRKVGK